MSEQKLFSYGIILTGGIAMAWLINFHLSSSSSAAPQSVSAQPASVVASSRIRIGELTVTVDEGWIQEAPSSSMRLTQFRLPASEPGIDDAELAVFSSIGGSVQDNLSRWFNQFSQPDGSDSQEKARVQEFSVNEMSTTIADLTGTFTGGGMPMSQPVEKKDYRLLAAIVVGASDVYYFKLVGPDKTVERWATSFGEFIGDLRSLSQ
ncbi:MAG: hypothetical protein QF674_07070 [Candidatus Marinimicrobia bacterium]|nr:hypothetical protein [Candidatus Neomarinimicrobiota bacterium]MDP7122371.1 hypothetical protein [Candidatus Neomarinimicrobiota bacterium]MDP7482929.1 hypothetical protein [Candidatus Neomarinimicrobiota bacterium]MDP7716473.1 hypothetical protein [Candidatus Neomarinimicrobiota bacterium]HJM10177.1 hypothetical protein [Candidatus Neomarinimicrobiota bacterium]